MGMDIHGRNPQSEAGKYFHANIWSWPPIHDLIMELCSDLLNEKMLRKLSYNDGAGPKDPEVCREMAWRFDSWMEQHTDGHKLDLGWHVTKGGRILSEEELAKNPDLETDTPHKVSDDHLKKWIEFLRDCGGFRVW